MNKPCTFGPTNFQLVGLMNTAFGNPQGDPTAIDWTRIRSQVKNIGHEFCELLSALGANGRQIRDIREAIDELNKSDMQINVDGVRDALCDIHVFAYGAHYLMGIDADRDMSTVIEGVMTRFIKDPADKVATIEKHEAKGVTEVYFEGNYPTMVMKSFSDQPDAPKGKFLKSASYKEPVFYSICTVAEPVQFQERVAGAFDPLPGTNV